VIGRFARRIFPGFHVKGDGVFRVLRDSDIEVEEEAEDLVRFFRSAIQRRRRGRVILLELDSEFDPEAEAMLREHLGLRHAMVTKNQGLLGIGGLATIVEEGRTDLKFAPYAPRYPERVLEHDGDCFAAIREKEFVVHHPYESFEVVVDFIRQAAKDPAVVSIKQTLYRAGNQSPVVAALIAALLAMPTQELDLQVVEGIQIRKAIADRAREGRVVGEELGLLGDRRQPASREVPFGVDRREHVGAQRRIRHERRVA
jgi:polyphosphate kinase